MSITIEWYGKKYRSIITTFHDNYIFVFKSEIIFDLLITSIDFDHTNMVLFLSSGNLTLSYCRIDTSRIAAANMRQPVIITLHACHVYYNEVTYQTIISIEKSLKVFLRIHNSSFAGQNSRGMYVHKSVIAKCEFEGTNFYNEVTLSLLSGSPIGFQNCLFAKMKLTIQYSSKIFVKNSTFKDSRIKLKIVKMVKISKSIFVNKTSSDCGGIIYSKKSRVVIDGCLFAGNYAQTLGGMIYNSGKMTIKNSILTASASTDDYVGNIIFSTSSLILQNVMINMSTGTISSPVIVYIGIPGFFRISNYVLQCPVNFDVKTNFNGKTFRQSANIISYCVPCKKDTYSLLAGRELKYRFHPDNVYHIKCLRCPSGGICENGIKSKDNQWGYVTENNTIKFITCPPHYCCSSIGSIKCTSYNTCAENREGILCGRCKPGFSENIASTKCIPNKHCTLKATILFSVAYAILALVITFSLMYFKEICGSVKRIIFKDNMKYDNSPLLQPLIANHETSDNTINIISDDDLLIDNGGILHNTNGTNLLSSYTIVTETNSRECLNKGSTRFGIVKLLVYFFQVSFSSEN